MQSSNSTFTYSPLLHNDSIRLLVLHPSLDVAADLTGYLLHTTTSECDRDLIEGYTALSYVWGDHAQRGQICLGGELVNITASLDAALRNIRSTLRPHRIWADALCIDQSNIVERGSQVAMMGQIYSTASNTVIYVGSLSPECATVLEAIAPMLPKLDQLTETENEPSDDAAAVIRLAESDLLARPWFTRVWVFQELTLSKDPWIQCGTMRVRWDELCKVLLPRGSKQIHSNASRLQLLANMNRARIEKSVDLADCLESRRGLGVTDSRDMVYAQLGVASDAKAILGFMPTSYNIPWGSVFTRAAAWIYMSRGFRYLCAQYSDQHQAYEQMNSDGGRDEGEKDNGNIPTWVPNWHDKYSYRVSIRESLAQAEHNRTSLHTPKNRRLHAGEPALRPDVIDKNIRIDPYSLTIVYKSCKQDVIRATSMIIPSTHSTWSAKWEQFSRDKCGYPTSMPESFGPVHDASKACLCFFEIWLDLLQNMEPAWGKSTSSTALSKESLLAHVTAWLRKMNVEKGTIRPEAHWSLHDIYWKEPLFYFMSEYMNSSVEDSVPEGRRFAVTANGSIGFVPASAQAGDKLLWGNSYSAMPLILVRSVGDFGDDLGSVIKQLDSQRTTRSDESPSIPFSRCKVVGECFFTQSSAMHYKSDTDRGYFQQWGSGQLLAMSPKDYPDEADYKTFLLH